MRLDSFLVKNRHFESRNKAKDAILNSLILINKKIIKKPSFEVKDNDIVEIKEHKFYISRAAKKLEEYLNEFKINIKNKIALDIGSSTGGFTQILLENGVKSIDCVDVGNNQLHQTLRDNPKINIYENMDIRKFNSFKKYELIVSDVSFISLNLIIDSINKLSSQNTIIILLFKPQFEVGKEVKRDSKGVVLDKSAIKEAKGKFLKNTKTLGWKLIDNRISKIRGKEGNIEEFLTFQKENND